jgi:acetate kinase
MEIIIVVNAGSSSIKFQVFNKQNFDVLASGLLERLYIDGNFEMKIGDKKISEKADLTNHEVATNFLISKLKEYKLLTNIDDLKGVGHRIVQGGTIFNKATKIEAKELKQIQDLVILAPLHNPGGISAIQAFQKIAPNAVNVADFDTAFHTTIPEENSTYAIPEK